MNQKIRTFGIGVVAAVWLGLVAFAWFGTKTDISDTERRELAQMPALSAEALLDGNFMTDFEAYAQDQFPLRNTFRQAKSLFHTYVLGQKDNHGIYIADDYAAELNYPLDESSLAHALGQFQKVYDKYLFGTDSRIYTAVVPDKSYYLAEDLGYPAMDHAKLFSAVQEGMPWAQYIDLTDTLTREDYYRSDTHWRQEMLLPTAEKIASAMDITVPKAEDYIFTPISRPFYGVYYGQAALPMKPETMYILQSDLLEKCRVYSYEKDAYSEVYNMEKLESKDLYDVFLSGAESLLRIENPNANTDRELIVFRDSYASSLIPLRVQDYRTVTLVDLRYLNVEQLGRFLSFTGQDVLFLHSTLVLNKKLI